MFLRVFMFSCLVHARIGSSWQTALGWSRHTGIPWDDIREWERGTLGQLCSRSVILQGSWFRSPTTVDDFLNNIVKLSLHIQGNNSYIESIDLFFKMTLWHSPPSFFRQRRCACLSTVFLKGISLLRSQRCSFLSMTKPHSSQIIQKSIPGEGKYYLPWTLLLFEN